MNKVATMREDWTNSAIFRSQNSPANDPLRSDGCYILNEVTIARLYDNYWLPRRIVDLPVDLALKDGFVEKKEADAADPSTGKAPTVAGAPEKPPVEPKKPPPEKKDAAAPPVVVAVKPTPGKTPNANAAPKAPGGSAGPTTPEPPPSLKPEDDELYQLWLDWNFRNDADGTFNRAAKLGRANGGAVIILGFMEEPSVELEEGSWPELAWIDVATRWELTPKEFEPDANSPRYKLPTIWELNAGHTRGPLLIHHTKMIFFSGLTRASRKYDGYDKYWTLSVLQPLLNSLFAYDDAMIGLSQGLGRFDVGVLKSAGLFEALHTLNRAEIDARQEIFNLGIANSRTIFLDPAKEEEWTRTPLAFTGVPEALEVVKADVSGGAGYPQTLIFGASPDGMNATGESDRAMVDDVVKAYRTNILTPALNKYMSAISGKDVEVSFDLKAPSEPGAPGEEKPAGKPEENPPIK